MQPDLTATGSAPAHEQGCDEMILGSHSLRSIDEKIGDIVFNQGKHPAEWFVVFGFAFILVNVMLVAFSYLIFKGVGIWGINIPVGWGFAIINFVWWIGIGHAGTLISAILLLLRQQWRNSINRFAEAMTIFAVMCAGLFPLFHTGRPWVAYWLFPYPSILGVWPQFRSPLVWDVFAVSTYMTVSILFWYVGLIPDLGGMRDRARNPIARFIFGVLAVGWRNSAKHWFRYETAYLILAGLSTPLVLSVHSIVSLDFAVAILPGWHTTIFPPFFVAGAVYAGFAMVLLLAIPIRKWYHLEEFITDLHLDWCAKVMLATGMVVFYGYLTEQFYAWYGGDVHEMATMHNVTFGAYAPIYITLLICNGVIPQLLWLKKVRYNPIALFLISLVVSFGMWVERFVIVVVSLQRDFLPAMFSMYYGTKWDYMTFFGTLGFFTFMMFLFIRFVPMINMAEMKDLWHRMHGRRAYVAADSMESEEQLAD
ncbi:MAG: polysulfide reductase NrfD [Armatimonadetes bacterium]|nr:polysulfide reductase NrfD [Armatimonadota bacterium]MDE2206823.1 polysulfide reductase NrfD [Armatimonadota bacterium]